MDMDHFFEFETLTQEKLFSMMIILNINKARKDYLTYAKKIENLAGK
jgi:hypothetical protein